MPTPPLRAYLATACTARFADEGVAVALALLALERTGSPTQGALALAAWTAPHAVAAPFVGALAERARAPRAFQAAALAVFASALAGLTVLLGRVPLPAVLGCAVVGGACGPVVTGGLSSLLAHLVPAGARSRAYALDAATYNAASVLAPAAVTATATLTFATPATALLAGAAAVAALCALRLPLAGIDTKASQRAADTSELLTAEQADLTTDGEPLQAGAGTSGASSAPTSRAHTSHPTPSHAPSHSPQPPPLARGLAAALGSLWRVPELRAVTASTVLAFVGVGGLPVTAVLLARGLGGQGAGGALMTAFAAGGLLGALAVARLRSPPHPQHLAGYALFGTGAALVAAALLPWLPAVTVAFALAGLCDGPLLAATLRVRAEFAPAGARTQVFTLGAGLKVSASAAGAALAGTLPLGPHPQLLAIAALHLTAAGLLPLLCGRPRPVGEPLPASTQADAQPG